MYIKGSIMKYFRKPEMRYFVAIILPPVAVFRCGKPIQVILNIFLTLLFWIPGMIHAILVVHSYLADKRNAKVVRAIRRLIIRSTTEKVLATVDEMTNQCSTPVQS